jgi:predicted ATPase
MVRQFCGDREETKVASDKMIDVCGRHGFAYWAIAGEIMRTWALAQDEAALEGIQRMEQNIRAWDKMEGSLYMPYWLALKAEVQRQAGQITQAYSSVKEGIAIAKKSGEVWWLAELLRLQGLLLSILGLPSAMSAASIAEALELAKRQGARSLQKRIAVTF